MKLSILALNALLAITLAPSCALAQRSTVETSALNSVAALPAEGLTHSASPVIAPRLLGATRTFRPLAGLGFATHGGVGGAGFDIATPLARKFNLRAGTDFFNYDTSFQEEGANLKINLHLHSGHVAMDWFPFGGRLRLSPQLVFGNNNRVIAAAVIPSGGTITLNGQDYISSYSDPLHGSGRIDFRKISPGFSFGFGNVIPRDRRHVSVPVDMGFYYAGQPSLQLEFAGSACDPNYPPSVGCESVDQDAAFQQNLAAFKLRNDHNLSYASFFPILSVGVGYRFW
ncbi:MAG TPA: hypothetical protein VHW70_05430 [Edaphobacter sp.]|nr:hypothetical protein [Edaphobacter sp.]